jgi:hypothetical protein
MSAEPEDTILLDFFGSNGTRISGPHWLDFFANAYFLGGPKIGQRINPTSRFVEDQVVALLQHSEPLTANDLKLIMAWKMGVIYQARSERERRIVYWPNWDQRLERYKRLQYRPSINWLADNMPSILQRINDGNPRAAFNFIANEDLVGFGPTYILTILFFVTRGQQPIYDRFAHMAALAIDKGLPPHSEVSYQTVRNWNEYEDYKSLLTPIVQACGQRPGSMTVPRRVDQALWVYGHLFHVPETQTRDRHETRRHAAPQISHDGADRVSSVGAITAKARQNSGDLTESDEGRRLSPIAAEHYKVARSLDSERPGRMFTAAKFKQRYRESYPNRNSTSIMPAGYSVPPSPSDENYPKFLKIE